MMKEHYVVIGSSRGLGNALVDELVCAKACCVTGIARTGFEAVPNHERWNTSGRYQHVEVDIGRRKSLEVLRKLSANFPPKKLCVIYNAACLIQDVNKDMSINHDAFEEVNRVGINGFGYVLRGFEQHLLKYGGTLTVISSINALKPPVLEPRIAYGATKAWLQMTMRCLRFVWPENVRLLTVYLGHIGGNRETGLHGMLRPSYSRTARKIIQTLSRPRIPHEITYPFIYRIMYNYILKLIPDYLYYKLLVAFFKNRFVKSIVENYRNAA